MQIPIELSGAFVAAVFALIALLAVVMTWAVCAIADEWEKAGFRAEGDRVELEGMEGGECM